MKLAKKLNKVEECKDNCCFATHEKLRKSGKEETTNDNKHRFLDLLNILL